MSVARRENAQRPKSVLGTWNIPGNGVLRNFDLEVAEELTFQAVRFHLSGKPVLRPGGFVNTGRLVFQGTVSRRFPDSSSEFVVE
jgi:hypothetical protein